jgi:inosine/xanthosine triphosphatase
MQVVKVAVGSTNQVKIEASKQAFEKFFPISVIGLETSSGVPAQPFGEETFTGARNRAKQALLADEFDFSVGIEGGLINMYGQRFGFAVVCVMSKDGRTGYSASGMFPLPMEVLKIVDEGKELGDAMDQITGMKDTKKGPGAVGLLTRGVIDRTQLYKDAVVFALIPFVNSELTWWPKPTIDK